MLPTLRPGDRLRIDVRGSRTHPPRPGDLVVLVDPEDPHRWIVKRVAAVGPGVWWSVAMGRGSVPAAGTRPQDAVEEIRLSPGALWVIGDNPERSRDSRQFGPIRSSAVVGRVFACYAPLDRRRRF
jgi:signal peptidase I